jgi:hypothetical protein
LLLCLAPRAARAENSVTFKHQDYRETGGRVAIKTQGAYVEQDFGTATHLKFEGILDSIAGATPTGEPAPAGSDRVPLTKLTEHRKAWSAALAHQFAVSRLAVGAANSRESDYVSTGWSLNAQTDFNRKNTTLLTGFAGTDDDIKVFYQTGRAKKRTNDVIVGVTQLLDPQTSVTLNLTWGRQRGYLSDPYKLVRKTTEIIPGVSLPLTFAENRPGEREKRIALLSVNRAFPSLAGAADAGYRYYRDTFGTAAHTVDLAWFQRLGERVVLKPSFRLYVQEAADFYYYRLDGTAVVPVSGPPRPQGPFYSSDYRLSDMRTTTLGLKILWRATDALHFDAAYERYDMRGRDGVTPQSAYVAADIVTLGAKFSW